MSAWAIWTFPVFMDLVVILLLSLQPYIAASAVLFGVFVPESDRQDAVVASLRKKYTIAVCVGGLVSCAAVVVAVSSWHADPGTVMPVMMALQMVTVVVVYWFFRRIALRLKQERHWQTPPAGKRVASLQFRKQPPTIANAWFAVHAVVAVGSALVAALLWDRIPDTLIRHYNAQGQPDGFSAKSFGSVFLLNLIQLLLTGLFLAINATIRSSRQLLDPNDPEKSMARDLRFRRLNSAFLWGLSLGIVMFFSWIQAAMIYEWPSKTILTASVTVSLVLIVTLAVFILYMSRKDVTPPADSTFLDDRLWRVGGTVYFNKNDPALFVQKRVGIGWTLNFARPLSWLVLGGMIGIPLLIVVLSAVLS